MLAPRPFPFPAWQGDAVRNGKVLVWAEQGLGDEIIFLEMLPDLIERNLSIVVECDQRLVQTVRRSFPTVTVHPRLDPPAPRLWSDGIVVQIAMGSLAQWLRPTLEDFRGRPYLVPDAARVVHWRRRLSELGPMPKVGIAWRTRGRDFLSRRGSTSLDDWGPILGLPSHFVRLQYDECSDELLAAQRRFGVDIFDFSDIDLFNDIDDSFALTAALDAVVCTSSSVSTIAGAVGTKNFVLTGADDYFLLGQEYYPWFSSSVCFRRRHNETWARPIADTAAALRSWLQGAGRQRDSGSSNRNVGEP
jgi:hypothetical protein